MSDDALPYLRKLDEAYVPVRSEPGREVVGVRLIGIESAVRRATLLDVPGMRPVVYALSQDNPGQVVAHGFLIVGDGVHHYKSSYCRHEAVSTGARAIDLHAACESPTGPCGPRKTPAACKVCASPCLCPNHLRTDDPPTP